MDEFKKGDSVRYTGKYILLSRELLDMVGVVRKVDREFDFSTQEETEVLNVYFPAIHDDRTVFAGNCELVVSALPKWEV